MRYINLRFTYLSY